MDGDIRPEATHSSGSHIGIIKTQVSVLVTDYVMKAKTDIETW